MERAEIHRRLVALVANGKDSPEDRQLFIEIIGMVFGTIDRLDTIADSLKRIAYIMEANRYH